MSTIQAQLAAFRFPPSPTTLRMNISFLDLPAEVRVMIWKYLFEGQVLQITRTEDYQPNATNYDQVPNVLFLCKAINTEATPILNYHLKLDYHCPDSTRFSEEPTLRRTPWHVRTLKITSYASRKLAEHGTELTPHGITAFSQLKHLTYNFNSTIVAEFTSRLRSPEDSDFVPGLYARLAFGWKKATAPHVQQMQAFIDQMRKCPGNIDAGGKDLSVTLDAKLLVMELGERDKEIPIMLTLWNDGQLTAKYEFESVQHKFAGIMLTAE